MSSIGKTVSREDLLDHDVLVIGGGNDALCAALSAREQGGSVLMLESAPREWRGGNSSHTRNLRCMHQAPTDVLTDAYLEDEFFDDVWRVTGGITNEALARHVIQASETCADWQYMQGGPGIFKGDLYFYRVDGDLRDQVDGIDTTLCPLHLLTGEYDFSCLPADTLRTAERIPGAEATVMKGLGHFPMSEDPAAFRRYILERLRGTSV